MSKPNKKIWLISYQILIFLLYLIDIENNHYIQLKLLISVFHLISRLTQSIQIIQLCQSNKWIK